MRQYFLVFFVFFLAIPKHRTHIYFIHFTEKKFEINLKLACDVDFGYVMKALLFLVDIFFYAYQL